MIKPSSTDQSSKSRGTKQQPTDALSRVGKGVTSGERSGGGVNEWDEHKGCELLRHFGKRHTIGPMQRTDHGNKPKIRPLATLREYPT